MEQNKKTEEPKSAVKAAAPVEEAKPKSVLELLEEDDEFEVCVCFSLVNIMEISDFILHRNLKVDHGKLLLLKRLMIHSCGRMIGKMMT